MKNTMSDLHNHLMTRIETLADSDITGEDLDDEVKRAKSIGDLAEIVIDNARTALAIDKHLAEYDRARAGSVLMPTAATRLIEAPRNGKGTA